MDKYTIKKIVFGIMILSYTITLGFMLSTKNPTIEKVNKVELSTNTDLLRERLAILGEDAKRSRMELETSPTVSETQEPICNSVVTEIVVQTYSDEDLYLLSHLIYAESSGCSDEHQLAVGSVVLNRVNDNLFPNSLYEVIHQNGQYSCTWNGSFERTPDEQSVNNAIYLLENGSQIPSNVLYQAEFEQGSSVWKQIGNTYFCYY